MWSPGFIPSLIVHGFLAGAFAPFLFAIARIPFGINSVSSAFRLGRLHTLIAIFSVISFCSDTGLDWVISRLNFVIPPALPWYHGLRVGNIPTCYGQLFRGLMDSELFWKYFLPTFAFQTIFDWTLFVYQDFFILFKDLGLGGSGTTFYGWVVGRMRFYAANASVLTPPRVPQTANPWRGRLNVLPKREGPRPTILGCTPQRQVDFPAPPNTTRACEKLYEEFVNTPEGQDHITVRTSYLEPGLIALRRTIQVPTNERGGPLDLRSVPLNSSDAYGGEIFHVHRVNH